MLPKSLQNIQNPKKFQEARIKFIKSVIHNGAQNLEVLEDSKEGLLITYCTAQNKPALIVWFKSRQKPHSWYRFDSEESRDTHIKRHVRDFNSQKELRKDNLSSNENIQIGDVFVASWGYEQTNIDFYEVTGKTGKSTLILREIAQERNSDSYLSGTCKPILGEFTGEPFKKRLNKSGYISFSSYKSANKVKIQQIGSTIVIPEYNWSAWH